MASTQCDPSPSHRVCFNCGQSESEPALKTCAKCSTALYCSRGCQKAHWKIHKKECRKPIPMLGPWDDNLHKATTPRAVTRWGLTAEVRICIRSLILVPRSPAYARFRPSKRRQMACLRLLNVYTTIQQVPVPNLLGPQISGV